MLDRQTLLAQRDHAWEQLNELIAVNELLRAESHARFVRIQKLEAEILRLRGW